MYQEIDGKTVYIVDLKAMPELPITGLTHGEEIYRTLQGVAGSLGVMMMRTPAPVIAQALTHALENGRIKSPGKYAIHLVPGTANYEIFHVLEGEQEPDVDPEAPS